MPFKLVIVPKDPEHYVIHNETPLKGLDFLTIATSLLRRVIDDCVKQVHHTLGDRKQYCIVIPNKIAIDSNLYDSTDTRYLYVDDNFLKEFVYYSAEKRDMRNHRNYPFIYQDVVVITSHIDELAVIEKWSNEGYRLDMSGSAPDVPEPPGPLLSTDIPIYDNPSEVTDPRNTPLIFDLI